MIIPKLETENELRCIKGSVSINIYKRAKIIISDSLYVQLMNGYANRINAYRGKELQTEIVHKRSVLTIKESKYIIKKQISYKTKSFTWIANIFSDNRLYQLGLGTGLIQQFDLESSNQTKLIDLSEQYDDLAVKV